MRDALEAAIADATGAPARIAGERALGGGCINAARAVSLDDGRVFFVKSNPDPLPGMFEAEAAGLRALAEPNVIRVPEVIAVGGGEGAVEPFLVLEQIESGRARGDYDEIFGRRFAELHRATRGERFGFDGDNCLGSTPQPNPWCGDWVEFWREHRLMHQILLAERNGLCDSSMRRLADSLSVRLGEIIGDPDEPACLLHGDLWGGNHLADERGEPVLIDPAVYRGRREADLAMTHLFGGFGPRFYAAYSEVWPLEEGARDRLEIYKLYHLLNHLNLFGASYLGGCLAILKRFG